LNPVALITGASRGIGRGIALEVARLGWDLVINFRANASAALGTARECVQEAKAKGKQVRAETFRADISQTADRHALASFVESSFKRIDLLVNNAGVAPEARTDILEATEDSFDQVLSINLKGPYFLTQSVARLMIAQTKVDPGSRPKIVTISSVSAYTASTNRGDYCLAKAALSMITPLYAARLAEHGINVYEIRPGLIATDMTEPVRQKYDQLIAGGLTPIKRWGTPRDVGLAVAAIAQDSFPFSTGEVLNVDGGFHVRRL
jgi:3-oxoacyl-[acyl-carrier protein] reductase